MSTANADNGGFAARRVIVRWAWRLFRREWRQQLLILSLLTFGAASAAAGVAAGYHLVPLRDGQFGAAQQRLELDPADPDALAASLAEARRRFAPVQVITHSGVPVPGSSESVDARSQDPGGTLGAPMLRLVEGRYPTGPHEVALTDGAAGVLRARVGGRIGVGAGARTVVGRVENPSDLTDEFVLLPPGVSQGARSVTVLLSASPAAFESFISSVRANGSVRAADQRGQTENSTAAAVVLGGATVLLLFICLVAAAGFVAVAQRRLRQLGMLAALGATTKHLRLVVLANGAAVGAAAAVVGSALGIGGWLLAAPHLESTAGHRIDRWQIPWWAVVIGMLLCLGTAVAAAWWPARAIARVPITDALSARPPQPKRVRRSAVVAVVLVAVGFGCLTTLDPGADTANLGFLAAGIVALVVGLLYACPLALRALAAAATRTPIGVRLALRDLARYQARSAAALAAISLALGIPVGTGVITAAAQTTAARAPTNLSDRQLLIRLGANLDPALTVKVGAAQLAGMQQAVDRITRQLAEPTVTALQMPVDQGGPADPQFAHELPVIQLREHGGQPHLLYVASGDLMTQQGFDPALLRTDAEVLTRLSGDLDFMPVKRGAEVPVARVRRLPGQGGSAAPTSLITPTAMQRHHWIAAPAGWFIEADRPLTAAQIAAALDLAGPADLNVETQRQRQPKTAIRYGALGVGAFLALAILALTVGLIRNEAAGDGRILTATGASSWTRRTITAATAGGLAFLGSLLGTAAVYAALLAAYHRDLAALAAVPIPELAAVIACVPVFATGAGWLLAGREPDAISGQTLA